MQAENIVLKKWKIFIEKWQASGLSQRAFCQNNGVGYSTFLKWKSRINQTGGSNCPKANTRTKNVVKFLPVTLKSSDQPFNFFENTATIKVQTGQHLISIYNGADYNTLKSVFQVINGLSC